jgi:hypothetical protein
MAKKKLFTKDVDQKLPFIRKTGKIETPEKSTPVKKKPGKKGKLQQKKKVGKLSKPSLPDKLNGPASSATGRQIHPGRYEKIKKDGALSRQGERARSEILLTAVRATFHIDRELLQEFKEKARQESRGLSELVNIAIRQYLKGKK